MARIISTAKRAGGALAGVLWPERSIVSRGFSPGGLSAADFAALDFLAGPSCDRCALPQPVDLGPETRCAACVARPPLWSRGRAALAYDDASKRPILALKRAGARDGLAAMAAWMSEAGRDMLEEADLLVPVPLHYVRLAQRGFNQAGWLAAALSRRTGVPVCVDALTRVRATPSQGTLSASARRRNVAGAFKARRSRLARLAGKRVVLVDDVYTTGATLNACARAVKRVGAAQVDALVLARVVKDRDLSL